MTAISLTYQQVTETFGVTVTDVCQGNNVTSAPISNFTFDINDPPATNLATISGWSQFYYQYCPSLTYLITEIVN